MGPRRVTVRARDTEKTRFSMQRKSSAPLSTGALRVLGSNYSPLLHGYLRELRARNLSALTIRNYTSDISGFLAGRDPLTVTRQDVRDYLGERKAAGIAASSIQRTYS